MTYAKLRQLNLDTRATQLLSRPSSEERVVAIVGARRADGYGLQLAYQLGSIAAQAGICVLSGGARGVDMEAHSGALARGGVSLAVLGCGLRHAPRRLSALQAQGLGLVSPYPDEASGLPWRFAKRNQHIAEACGALIVVQALKTSGSLMSARHALSLGKPVWVCPGPLTSPHAGCYTLLEEGARLLTDPQAWLSALGGELIAPVQASDLPICLGSPTEARRPEPPPDSALYQVSGPTPMTIGELAERAQMSLPSALSEATLLELSGWLTATPTGAFIRVEGSG